MSLNKKLDELLREIEEEEIEEASTIGGEGSEEYNSKYAFGKTKDKTVNNSGYNKVKESTFIKMSKLMNEVSYKEYKKDESLNSRQKVNKSIREVASKLYKIERLINQNIKLKTEDGVDSRQYWKSTRGSLYKISERMMRISEKLRKF
jgi:hypothetical protein